MKSRAYHAWLAVAIVFIGGFATIIFLFPGSTLGPRDTQLNATMMAIFLDETVEVDDATFKGYSAHLDKMRRVVGKPIIVPDGVMEFADGLQKGAKGDFFPRGFGPVPDKLMTRRKFLDDASSCLGMTWTYNPASDAIVLDFPWRRDDSRNTQQLVSLLHGTLMGYEVEEGGKIYQRFYPYIKVGPVVFDALLSNPTNFSSAWKVRLADDMRRYRWYTQGPVEALPVEALLLSKIKDTDGTEHVLVVNSQPGDYNLMSLGQRYDPMGSITYYVFDLQGKFEQGGMWYTNYRGTDCSVWLDSKGKRLTLHVPSNDVHHQGTQPDRTFVLTRDGLVIDGAAHESPVFHVPN